MESIERLRKMDGEMLVPLGNGQYVPDHSHNDIADQIEAEIVERYMELPTDADGVPIKVGDEIETRDGEKVNAHFVTEDEVAYFNSSHILTWDVTDEMRHVKPRTLEDVLQCAGVSIAAIEDVAAEIRELLGVGE